MKEARERKFKRAIACAQALNVPRSTYQGYESGNTSPPDDCLEQFAELVSCNFAWLVWGFGSIDGPPDKHITAAVQEARAKYGKSTSIRQLGDAVIVELRDLLEDTKGLLAQERENNQALRIQDRRAAKRILQLETQDGDTQRLIDENATIVAALEQILKDDEETGGTTTAHREKIIIVFEELEAARAQLADALKRVRELHAEHRERMKENA